MLKNIIRSSLFWIVFASFSLAGAIFSYYYFPHAFSLINLDLKMNRSMALQDAQKISNQLHLGPSDYHQAASFEVDKETNTFIELGGGGKQALDQVLADKIYSPYHWVVRHFVEFNPHEVKIYFNPDGNPYGFTEKIAEDTAGPALTQKQTQEIAENQAQEHWNVNFSDYSLAEVSHEEKPNKRLDYTFVYEHTKKMVGNAHYRLTLIVQGDRLTQIKPSIQVPEGFKRRYEHMRSANQTISIIALFFIAIFYLFICGLGGLMYLYRRKLLHFKIPIIWGGIIATFQAINSLNSTPLMWLQYDTATSTLNFLTQVLLIILLQWGLLFCVLSLIFMVAEGLTRCAFGDHPQFWKVWRPEYAASPQILGRTLGGYLIVGLDIAFVVITYAFTTRYLGWWTPSDALINPNILATYVPWFSSLAQSAMAGFMEECLFRAIPLACAYLVGKYFKRPTLFLAVAFILQAIIFGAAHANYPAQPAYARLLELIIPSAVFGGLYLAYGLLPAIISHFVYDVVWFALPLFVDKAPGTLFNQFMVILGALVPLIIVLIARLRIGAWKELPIQAYNKAEEFPAVIEESRRPFDLPPTFNIQEKYNKILLFTGLAGILLWVCSTRFDHDGIRLPANRNDVIAKAEQLLNVEQSAARPWRKLANVKKDTDPNHIFIWRTQGQEAYHALLGTYILPAYWLVRFASFEGDVAERAQEYQWRFGPDHTIVRKQHILAEEQPGKTITQEEASIMCLQAAKDFFQFKPENVKQISAISSKKPHRIDWTFTCHTPASVDLEKGQTRTTTTVANNEVTDIYRHIFVPETWLREYKNEQTIHAIITTACALLLILLFIFLSSLCILHVGFFNIHYPTLIAVALFFLTKSFIQLFNLWPVFESSFSTSQPYSTQAGTHLIILLIQIIMHATLFSYLASIIHYLGMHILSTESFLNHILMGISAGIFYGSISSFLNYLAPSMLPTWPEYSYLGAHNAWLNMALVTTTSFVTLSIYALLTFIGLDYFTQAGQRRIILGIIICLLLGITLTGAAPIQTIPWWIISGLARGLLLYILYIYFFRFERTRIIWATATISIGPIIQQAFFNAWDGVLFGTVLASILITVIALIWTWSLHKKYAR